MSFELPGSSRLMQFGVALATTGMIAGCQSAKEKKTVVSDQESIQKPNILFIAVDDLRPELGCYGDSTIKTPNIDRLAKRGVTFTHAYCQQAVCNPSRASLLTGLRPDSIEVWDLRTDFRIKFPDLVTLPQYFKQNGYYTTATGKIFHNNIQDSISWHKKLHVDGWPYDPDAVYADEDNIKLVEKRKQEIIAEGKQEKYIDQYGKWYIKTMATEDPDVGDDAYYDGVQTKMAIRKLAEYKERDEPFFFAVGYYHPHLPFNAPKKYWDMYDRDKIPLAENDFIPKNAPEFAMNRALELRRSYMDFKDAPDPFEDKFTEEQARLLKHGYYASVSYSDAQIGRLIDELDRLGLSENTVIILWGDHGWKLGEHNSWCKQTNYEIDTRVPMIIVDPRAGAKGVISDALVEFVDIYPTLCDVAGLKIPGHLHGVSMKPLLDKPDKEWKSAAFSQFLRGSYRPREDGRKYMGYAIRTERYRYVEWTDFESGEFVARELYDHKFDPEENENIAGLSENEDIVKELADKLKAGCRKAVPLN